MPNTPARRQPERDMTAKTNPTQPFTDRLDAAASGLPGGGRPWLDRLRAEARAAYREAGLPGPKVEAWKYTNLNRLRRMGFAADAAQVAKLDTVPVGNALSMAAHLASLPPSAAAVLPTKRERARAATLNGGSREHTLARAAALLRTAAQRGGATWKCTPRSSGMVRASGPST